jgi:hypothetical protein
VTPRTLSPLTLTRHTLGLQGERAAIERALREHGQAGAPAALGVTRRALRLRCLAHGLPWTDGKAGRPPAPRPPPCPACEGTGEAKTP